MDKESVLKIIERFRKALSDNGIGVSKIILYGSYARGDWHEWSDIDLIVVSEDFAGMGYWERIDVLVEAIYKVRQPIEAVPMTDEQWEKGQSMIARFARQTGELVYAA